MKEYTLELAPLSKPIKEQLESQDVYMTEHNYIKYEKLRKAINMVAFHLATESEIRKLVKRFYVKVQYDVYDERPIEVKDE
jgi:hypothetical protein